MDLSATSRYLLTPEDGVLLVETNFKGPLPPHTVGLVLGRASAALLGLTVIPGVIDSDFQGTVKVMVQSSKGAMVINKGDKFAQLLLLPSLHERFPSSGLPRGENSFGSSGSPFIGLHLTLDQRPTLEIKLNGRSVKGLLDTGADRTVIAEKDWPPQWPTNKADQVLQGLGFASCPSISARPIFWEDAEGHSGQITPFVLPLPFSLWGRDLLVSMDVALVTATPAVRSMMMKQGYVPGRGLGPKLQGEPLPVRPSAKLDRKGLGFS